METAEAEHAEKLPNFTQLLDKALAARLAIKPAWCPTMDLVALASIDNIVTIHRLSWQKLLSITVEDEKEIAGEAYISALTWKPDGRAIAVGTRSGRISLYDVEDGHLISTSSRHEGCITALLWAAYTAHNPAGQAGLEEPTAPYEDRTTRFFDNLPEIPKFRRFGIGAAAGLSLEKTIPRKADPTTLGLLVSGDELGVVRVGAFGIVPVGTIRISSQATPHGSVVSLSISSDFESLLVVYGRASGAAFCRRFDTTVFSQFREELRSVTTQTQHVTELLQYSQAVVASMEQHWTSAKQTINRSLLF